MFNINKSSSNLQWETLLIWQHSYMKEGPCQSNSWCCCTGSMLQVQFLFECMSKSIFSLLLNIYSKDLKWWSRCNNWENNPNCLVGTIVYKCKYCACDFTHACWGSLFIYCWWILIEWSWPEALQAFAQAFYTLLTAASFVGLWWIHEFGLGWCWGDQHQEKH